MAIEKIIVIHGGELAKDVAEQLQAKKPSSVAMELRSASKSPKSLMDTANASTLHCFIMQTIENAAPTEDGGSTLRFFKRKTQPADLLSANGAVFQYTVLGLGDSNLLLDRQTTSAKDCNQVAQELDKRLEQLGGSRFYNLGQADERSELVEVEPWIQGLLAKFWADDTHTPSIQSTNPPIKYPRGHLS